MVLPRQSDEILKPYIQAQDEAESQRLLEHLITAHAEPVIRQIITYKLRTYSNHDGRGYINQEADDLHGEVILKLLTSLQDCKNNPVENAITNFRSYTAVISYHACSDHLRRKYPRRHSLRSKLRRLLTRHPGMALWESAEGDFLGGYAVWREQKKALTRNSRYQQLSDDPHAFSRAALPEQDVARMNPAVLIAAIFDWVGGPIELDDLMIALAVLWGIQDRPDLGDVKFEGGQTQAIDPRADVANEVTRRLYLKRLWEEISQLSSSQCLALLLNLRDENGASMTALLPIAGIASIRQIAQALGLPPEVIYRLWGELPLNDATIAGMLKITRQQVINLRKSARERLARRMRALD